MGFNGSFSAGSNFQTSSKESVKEKQAKLEKEKAKKQMQTKGHLPTSNPATQVWGSNG